MGLANLGYTASGSDLSPDLIDMATQRAAEGSLSVDFSVADMRDLRKHHGRTFDVVISCGNSIPHLLSDEDISRAFHSFFDCIRPGGGFVVDVRDYDAAPHEGVQFKPFGVKVAEDRKFVLFQVWTFRGDLCDVDFYFIEDQRGECTTRVMRTTLYAVSTQRLQDLARDAGFVEVCRIDEGRLCPAVIGTKAA